MSGFTFDFDLEDDLDESFDAIPAHELAAVSSVDKTLVSEGAPGEVMPAVEITLSALVRVNFFLGFHHHHRKSYLVRQHSSPHSPKRSRIRP
jgi:hypothetical protein